MTTEFDHEEIENSSFPVEFNENTTSLDMYGVWVKSGPREISLPTKKHVNPLFIPTEDQKTDSEIFDISSLPDLPDLPDMPTILDEDSLEFDDSENFEMIPEMVIISASPEITQEIVQTDTEIRINRIEFEDIDISEEIVPDFPDILPEIKTYSSKLETILESQFDEIDTQNFIGTEKQTENLVENDIFSIDPSILANIQFENIREDELSSENHSIGTIPSFPISYDENVIETTQNRVFENIQFADIPEESLEKESLATTSIELEPYESSTENEFTIMEFDELLLEEAVEEEQLIDEIDIPKNFEFSETNNETTTEDYTAINNDELDIQALATKISAEFDETDLLQINTHDEIPSDEDFSSFLNDLNTGTINTSSTSSSSSGDLDLDSFIDSFNESGGTAHDEKAKIFDDIDPVDIELDFDESFIADSEKIKATGSAVSESEFFDSEFGVELIDETIPNSMDDFNSMFESISDFDEMKEKKDDKTETTESRHSILEETDEFNDLLKQIELTPSPAQRANTPIAPKKTYALSVTDEDGFDAPSSTVIEKKINEVNVSLYAPNLANEMVENQEIKKEPPKSLMVSEEDFLDISIRKDYNNTESDSKTDFSITSAREDTVSLDFDDISAVEQELNDFTPETGEETVVTNDKSTELLMIIADELSSIKQEISTLKNELAGFKPASFQNESIPSSVVEPDTTENSGFFTDDDTDETIALTGDELNNILITADFTEEKNEENITEIDESNDNIETIQQIKPDFDNIGQEIPETLPDSIFEVSDLSIDTEVNVAHVNDIHEDTSYLEGSDFSDTTFDDVAIDEPELEVIDFSDEKLEEPELTEFNIDLADINSEFQVEAQQTIQEELTTKEIENEPFEPEAPSTEQFNSEMVDEIIELDTPEDLQSNTTSLNNEIETEELNTAQAQTISSLPIELKEEIKSVLSYMDQLLESLPEDKIEEFARSEHFEVYKKLFEELGIS